MRALFGSLVIAVPLFFASSARASEPASWLQVGAGYFFARDSAVSKTRDAMAVAGQIGIGTSLANPFSVGVIGGFRFDLGVTTDLTLGVRGATRGYMLGDWGVAVDLGLAARLFEPSHYGHVPFEPSVTIGLPWGPVIQGGADIGDVFGQSPAAAGFFVIGAIDFVRLVAARAHGTASFFPDPPPPGDREIIHLQ